MIDNIMKRIKGFFSTLKVDYSVEAKKNYRPNMAGEFAIYERKNIFSKWVESSTYASLSMAISYANDIHKKKRTLPKYYL